jgi:hypothetical protein
MKIAAAAAARAAVQLAFDRIQNPSITIEHGTYQRESSDGTCLETHYDGTTEIRIGA